MAFHRPQESGWGLEGETQGRPRVLWYSPPAGTGRTLPPTPSPHVQMGDASHEPTRFEDAYYSHRKFAGDRGVGSLPGTKRPEGAGEVRDGPGLCGWNLPLAPKEAVPGLPTVWSEGSGAGGSQQTSKGGLPPTAPAHPGDP